ncbi:MAG: (2Fe-2S)-binding protein [Ruminococcaceae bacterium]|nr:(2Fe-2S)-binding protein [Oscillospiraceae bacterium]
MLSILLSINGRDYPLQVEPNWTLLYVIRELLRLTGSKYGCGTGDCGACKVLIDGEAKNSCTLLARNMEGKKIVTIEGASHGGQLHPVQQAFIDAGAIQCGFCTPGMVITSIALLSKSPDPTEDEILEALGNNLCRCTGYKKIVEAIRLAALQMQEKEVIS